MTQDEYNKTRDILAEFPNSDERYKKSALFHKVVQILVREDNPYKVIDQLVTAMDDLQKAFEYYMITH